MKCLDGFAPNSIVRISGSICREKTRKNDLLTCTWWINFSKTTLRSSQGIIKAPKMLDPAWNQTVSIHIHIIHPIYAPMAIKCQHSSGSVCKSIWPAFIRPKFEYWLDLMILTTVDNGMEEIWFTKMAESQNQWSHKHSTWSLLTWPPSNSSLLSSVFTTLIFPSSADTCTPPALRSEADVSLYSHKQVYTSPSRAWLCGLVG